MTDAEILTDPVFRQAFATAVQDPDLIDDVINLNDLFLQSLGAPYFNRLALVGAMDLIAKHSRTIQ